MQEKNKIRAWIEQGKQVGTTLSFSLSGETCWSSVAIQKHHNIYKLHVDEVLEKNMTAEIYTRNELHRFHTLEEAAQYVNQHTQARFELLQPCKGHRLFNPELDH